MSQAPTKSFAAAAVGVTGALRLVVSAVHFGAVGAGPLRLRLDFRPQPTTVPAAWLLVTHR